MVCRILLLWMSIFCILTTQAVEDCDDDSDCRSFNTCEDGECKHKDLMDPKGSEIGGTLLIILFAALSNAGGIGGGPIMIPILIILFSFNAHFAVPLS